MGISRGTIVRAVLLGDFGKPRPALIVQADAFNDEECSLVLCPITSDLQESALIRPFVLPDATNGLRLPSHIMIDKISVVTRRRIGPAIGRLDDETMFSINRTLALFLGVAA
jgi:mRNA interferase MazF